MAPQTSNAVYLGPAHWSQEEAAAEAQHRSLGEPIWLGRRGYSVGWIAQRAGGPAPATPRALWQAGDGVFLPRLVAVGLEAHADQLSAAQILMSRVLDGESAADLITEAPYAARLAPQFDLLAATSDEGDPQEIETLEFDGLENGEVVAENLWVKLSWLSFDEEDASLRLRFSFGIAGYEDVASDYLRQQFAAQLTDAIFPESSIISSDPEVERTLCETLAIKAPAYVERIIYFNAPNGGAQFHQDVERGHLGVIFAQAYGRTGWFALPKQTLVDEIRRFLARADAVALLKGGGVKPKALKTLQTKAAEAEILSAYMDDHDNDPLEALLNRVPEFSRQLVEAGYAYILQPGDVILLPQQDIEHCCWHSVFCLDDFAGEALSFAVRERP